MKTYYSLMVLLFAAAILISNTTMGQELPGLSPASKVEQRSGLTDVSITYSSPAVRGRVIWGGLVPYDEWWRTGANAATRIEFSETVKINGVDLSAKEYGILMMPGKEEWTVLFSKNRSVRASNRKEEDDAVLIKVKPVTIPHRERMSFLFSDYDYDKMTVSLEWEKIRISFDVALYTHDQAIENIDEVTGWRTYVRAGRYHYEMKEYDKALGYLNKSLEYEERWYTLWYKANTLHEHGQHKEAYKALQRTKELGDKDKANDKNFFFEDRVNKAIVEWSVKG